MYFDDIKAGMTVEIAPAVIEKGKMPDFARLYGNILCTQTRNTQGPPPSDSLSLRSDVIYVGVGNVFGG